MPPLCTHTPSFDSYNPMDIDPTDIEDEEEFLDVLTKLHLEELTAEESEEAQVWWLQYVDAIGENNIEAWTEAEREDYQAPPQHELMKRVGKKL